MTNQENIAPKDTVWVCRACGKIAIDKYKGKNGWDESCMLNAILCHYPKLGMTWEAVDKKEPLP